MFKLSMEFSCLIYTVLHANYRFQISYIIAILYDSYIAIIMSLRNTQVTAYNYDDWFSGR